MDSSRDKKMKTKTGRHPNSSVYKRFKRGISTQMIAQPSRATVRRSGGLFSRFLERAQHLTRNANPIKLVQRDPTRPDPTLPDPSFLCTSPRTTYTTSKKKHIYLVEHNRSEKNCFERQIKCNRNGIIGLTSPCEGLSPLG